MSSQISYHLRLATPADDAFLEQLYFDAHVEEFRPMGLAEPELKALLQMQWRAQRTGYAHDFADAVDSIVMADESALKPIGRLLVATRRDAIHLVDIALLSAARGRGIGSRLIRTLLEDARRRNLPVRLHVRPGNPAFQLYSRLGFRLIGGGMNLAMEFTPGPAAAQTTLPEQAAMVASDPLPIQQWSSLQGRSFRVMELPPEDFPPLHFARLERVAFAGSVTHSLIFHGPAGRFLPQAIYSLRLCDEHTHQPVESEDRVLFLVPIGPTANAMQYEAIFSELLFPHKA